MPKHKTPKPDHRAPSAVALNSLIRSGAGVHDDQRRRQCPKALRRDKSYKRDYS